MLLAGAAAIVTGACSGAPIFRSALGFQHLGHVARAPRGSSAHLASSSPTLLRRQPCQGVPA